MIKTLPLWNTASDVQNHEKHLSSSSRGTAFVSAPKEIQNEQELAEQRMIPKNELCPMGWSTAPLCPENKVTEALYSLTFWNCGSAKESCDPAMQICSLVSF